MEGERRVTFTVLGKNGKPIEGKGTLIGQGRAGGGVIPDNTREVLSLRPGEFTILPDKPQSLADQTRTSPRSA